jgi:putative membrane protein
MKTFLIRWLVMLVAIFIAANLSFLGIRYDTAGALIATALVLSLINTFVKPVLMLITLPFILLTFGLLVLMINAAMFSLAGSLVDGFHVDSFGSALGGAIVVSLVSFLLNTDRKTVIVHQRTRTGGPPPGRGPIIDI